MRAHVRLLRHHDDTHRRHNASAARSNKATGVVCRIAVHLAWLMSCSGEWAGQAVAIALPVGKGDTMEPTIELLQRLQDTRVVKLIGFCASPLMILTEV